MFPWATILSTLLPIILAPHHPHAQEAHQVLRDAHDAAADPVPAPDKLVDVLSRALTLSAQARQIGGATDDPNMQVLIQSLLATLAHKSAPTS